MSLIRRNVSIRHDMYRVPRVRSPEKNLEFAALLG